MFKCWHYLSELEVCGLCGYSVVSVHRNSFRNRGPVVNCESKNNYGIELSKGCVLKSVGASLIEWKPGWISCETIRQTN